MMVIYGSMSAGKSKHLIHTYDYNVQRGKVVKVFTGGRPNDMITSRDGNKLPAYKTSRLPMKAPSADVVLVDEAQWLTQGEVKWLHKLSSTGVDVYLYGITSDTDGNMYPSIGLAMCIADALQKIALTKACSCGSTDIPHMHLNHGSMYNKDDYEVVCSRCFYKAKED